MDGGHRKQLESRLQAILGELNQVCSELGLELEPETPAPLPAPPKPIPPEEDALEEFKSGQVLLCWLGTRAVGFIAEDIQELARMVEVTQPVDPRPEVEGYIDVRGHATPVVHLRHLMGQGRAPHTPEQFLVFLRHKQKSIAVVLDEVEDIFEVTEDEIQGRDELSKHRGLVRCVVHINDQLVGVIDPARLVRAAL